MREEKESTHRLAAYSGAVFAVIVTIMVLELKAPDEPRFSALRALWPTAISYAVSYLFIAIIWINQKRKRKRRSKSGFSPERITAQTRNAPFLPKTLIAPAISISERYAGRYS